MTDGENTTYSFSSEKATPLCEHLCIWKYGDLKRPWNLPVVNVSSSNASADVLGSILNSYGAFNWC